MEPTVETIWNECSQHLRAFIRSRVEDETTSEDLLQEVFLRIHTHMHTLKSTERLESWVYQIARNVIIDHYRSRRDLTELDESLPAEDSLPTEPDTAQEVAIELRPMVEALPETYRQALILSEFEGLNLQEVAVRLGISLSGAKSRVQRGRQKLKDQLLTCCHYEFDRYGRIVDYWERCCCCCELNQTC